MDQETRKNYIDMIDKVGSGLSLTENLKNFINTYNGEENDELHLLVASAIGALIKYEQAKIKADGYDQVVVANQDFNEWFSGIKNEYKMLEDGIMPPKPPVLSPGEGYEEVSAQEQESDIS